jgi:DNA replication protein DnaC
MPTPPALSKFKTFGEKPLAAILDEASRFHAAIKAGKKPYWLSILGNCGTGKTFISRLLYRAHKDRFRSNTRPGDDEISYGSDWVYWPTAAEQLKQGIEPDSVYHGRRTQFMVFDDIGTAYDKSGYSTNRLAVLLGSRVGKWTVITANVGLEKIGQLIDERIASRMIRDENVCIEVKAMDFSLRRNKD